MTTEITDSGQEEAEPDNYNDEEPETTATEKLGVARLSVCQPSDDSTMPFDEPILTYGAAEQTGDVFGDAVEIKNTVSNTLGGIPEAVEEHVDMRRSGKVGTLHVYENGSWEFNYEYGEDLSGVAAGESETEDASTQETEQEGDEEDEDVSALDRENARRNLTRVRGIGDSTADTLIEEDIMGVSDLREELLDGNESAWDALNKRFYDTMAVQLGLEPHDPPEDVSEFHFIEVPWSEPEDTVYDERQDSHVFVYTSDEYGYVRAGFTHFGPFIEYESEGSWQVELPVSSFGTVRRKFPREDVNRAYMEFLELLATGRAMELLVGEATRPASAYDLGLNDGDVVQLDYSEGADTVEITDVGEGRFEATLDGETVVFGYHRITDDGVYGPLVYDHPDVDWMVSKLYGVEVVESAVAL